jgi:flagellin-specific chaperone FliS
MDARLSHRAVAAQGASLRLVILLYNQAIADLQFALSALASGDVQGGTRMNNHVLAVIGCLHGTLKKGQCGGAAEGLDRFYSQLRAALLRAQICRSKAGVRHRIAGLMRVREARDRVEQLQTAAAAPSHTKIERGDSSREKWKAYGMPNVCGC